MGRASTVDRQGYALERAETQTDRRRLTLLPPTEWRWWYAIAGYVGAHVLGLALALATHAIAGTHFVFPARVAEVDLCFLATVLVFSSLRGGVPSLRALGFVSTRPRPALGWAILLLIAAAIFRLSVVRALHPATYLDPLAHPRNGALVILVAATIVPIAEEVFYRGFIYRALRVRFDIIPAALIGGLMFGAAHLLYGGYPGWQALTIGFEGFLLCLLYEQTGSLWPCIAVHAFIDGIAAEVQVTGGAGVGGLIAVVVAVVALVEPGRWRPAVRRWGERR
jgi:membrane protease YdiL (CAAX protease family)